MSNEEQLAYDKGQADKCQYTDNCFLHQENQALKVEIERLNSEISYRDQAIDEIECQLNDAGGELELWQRENAVIKQILNAAMKKADLCNLCAMKGQTLEACKCMTNAECINNMILLWSCKK